MSQSSLSPPTKNSNVMSIYAITSPSSGSIIQSENQLNFSTQHQSYNAHQASVLPLSSLDSYEFSPIFINRVNDRTTSQDRIINSFDTMNEDINAAVQKQNLLDQCNSEPSSPSLTAASVTDSNSDFHPCDLPNSPPYTPSWLTSLYENKKTHIKQLLETAKQFDLTFSKSATGDFNTSQYQHSSINYEEFFKSEKFGFCGTEKYSGTCRIKKNGEAAAKRRARNKLASAKYRAKKQAHTHAMQDRIMQLVTQVISLSKELSQTKAREKIIIEDYKQLITVLQKGQQFIESTNSSTHYNVDGFEQSKLTMSTSVL